LQHRQTKKKHNSVRQAFTVRQETLTGGIIRQAFTVRQETLTGGIIRQALTVR
jgi:hypothetical protein